MLVERGVRRGTGRVAVVFECGEQRVWGGGVCKLSMG
jgi:hypothetical protein